MSTEFNKVKSGVIFTKAAQKQDLQSGDTIPEALGKLAKYMDVTDDALSNIQPILTFDSEPEYESLNPVTSGGLYDYIELQSPTYINTFSTESDLYNYSGNLTNNDYAFVGTGSGATYYMNVYQYKSEVIRDTIENIKTVPSGSNILKTLNEPALPSGNIQYKLDCYVTAVNNQSYGTSPVITVIFSDNTTAQITVPNANKTHIVKTYSKTIKAIQFMNGGQASNGYTDFEDIKILTTSGWNKLSYRLYNPTWDANQLSAINSGITSTKVTNYDNHIANKSNPHEVTKSQVGLGNVGNFKAVSTEASQGLTNTEQSNARTNINAQESLSFSGTYNASTNKVATESTVTNAINALDVSSQGGAGKYISEISETNGKVSATPTTMDTSLSNSSTNNNCPTSKTVYDDQQRQDAALAEVENKGAKNILKTYDIPETTSGNVVFSIIDGVCSVSTTATQTTAKVLVYAMDADVGNTSVNSRYTIPRGTYILKTTGNGKVKLRAIEHDGTNTNLLGETTGADAEFTYSETMPYVVFTLSVSSNTSLSETVTFIPMCCLKAEYIIDQTAVKYGKTNAELTAENTSQQAEINYAVNTGSKNLLKNTRTTTTHKGITFTINDDGSVTANGTNDNTGASVLDINTQTSLALSNGNYILTGCPAGGSDSGYMMDITRSPGSSIKDTGNGATFTVGGDYTVNEFRIVISRNVTVNNLIFYPMIRPASITNSKYVPYSPSNRELYEDKATVDDIFGVKTSLTAGIDLNDLTTPGKYTCGGAAIAMQLLHCPTTTNAFIMLVDQVASESRIIQRIYSYNTAMGAFEVFYRSYISTGWTDWQRGLTDATLDEIPTANSTNAVMSGGVQAPLAEVIDNGAKNLFDINKTPTVNHTIYTLNNEILTVTSNGNWANYNVPVTLSAGDYVFRTTISNFSKDSSAGATSVRIRIAEDTSGGTATELVTITGNGNLEIPFSWTGGQLYIQFYTNFSSTTTFITTFTASDNMICTATDWAVSKKFVPYAPTNRELYEKVNGLGTELVANTNLDNLNIGTYYCGGATIGATLLNSPTIQPFRLIVSYFQSPTNMMQKIIDFNTSTSEIAIYIRVKTSSGWKSWYKFEGTEVT